RDVAKCDVDAPFVTLGAFDRFIAAARREDVVAQAPEHTHGRIADELFVVDDEDASFSWLCRDRRARGSFELHAGEERQENAKARSAALLRFDDDVPAVLVHDSVAAREAEPRPARFGREEWIEDLAAGFLVHADARIRHFDLREFRR